MSIIRDNLHTITTEDLTATQINKVSGGVYLSRDAQQAQDEIVDIVSTVRSVKVPFYGTPIPGTFAIAATTAAVTDEPVDIVSPTGNQTYQLLAISAQNLNAAAVATGDIYLTDGSNSVKLAQSGSIAALSKNTFDLTKMAAIYFTKEVYISGVSVTGIANLLQFNLVYCKVVQ